MTAAGGSILQTATLEVSFLLAKVDVIAANLLASSVTATAWEAFDPDATSRDVFRATGGPHDPRAPGGSEV